MEAAAEFRDVSKEYRAGPLGRRRVRAVAGVSLAVRPGEVFGLLGPNRAGKTTLVKMLLSLCRPTAGQVVRLGRPARDRATLARVGYVHEHQSFPRYLTPAGLLHYYGALTHVADARRARLVPALLERVGLADRAAEPIAGFSKGMVQRLGLAQALLNEPDLLVLDEPAEGLDLLGLELVRELVAERRAAGAAVILVSHQAAEVERLCDRAAVVVAGRLAAAGPVADVGGAGPLESRLRALYGGGAT